MIINFSSVDLNYWLKSLKTSSLQSKIQKSISQRMSPTSLKFTEYLFPSLKIGRLSSNLHKNKNESIPSIKAGHSNSPQLHWFILEILIWIDLKLNCSFLYLFLEPWNGKKKCKIPVFKTCLPRYDGLSAVYGMVSDYAFYTTSSTFHSWHYKENLCSDNLIKIQGR